jgi:hypothetical protein
MTTPRCGLTVVAIRGLVYALGGTNNSDNTALATVEMFDPNHRTWVKKKNLPHARTSFGAGVLGAKIYVAGGADGMKRLASVDVYDPATDAWDIVASMTDGRSGVAAVGDALRGLFYVLGGSGVQSNLKLVEAYDPKTNSWHSEPPLLAALDEPAAVAGVDGTIFVVGGSDGPNIEYDSWQLQHNGSKGGTGKWVQLKAEMHKSRLSCGLAMVKGVMYAVGGFSNEPPVILAETVSLHCA